ncbi:MAG: IclR family transcriptional regulator [Burkholderiaceae bacterium]|nr:IclR family transcriptional regulator [Burkholderiaceae bacterium]
MATAQVPEKLVGALISGLSILRYLAASSSPIGVSRIAKDLNLNSSTCFNLLKTLVHERLVIFDDTTKTYTIGIGLVELAKGALEQASYVRMLHPHLEEIASRHSVTATLWQRASDERVVLVDRADNSSAIRVHMSIGQRLPMYIAALGRCMAAFSGLSPAELRRRVSELRWEDGPSFDEYLSDVKEVLKRGYAVDLGNYVKGVSTVSAAVLDSTNRPVMAISAVGFSAQLSAAAIKVLGEDLRDRAAEITLAMSGRGGSRL